LIFFKQIYYSTVVTKSHYRLMVLTFFVYSNHSYGYQNWLIMSSWQR